MGAGPDGTSLILGRIKPIRLEWADSRRFARRHAVVKNGKVRRHRFIRRSNDRYDRTVKSRCLESTVNRPTGIISGYSRIGSDPAGLCGASGYSLPRRFGERSATDSDGTEPLLFYGRERSRGDVGST